eukprot:5087836-Ditylum_brightwellii.AAC.1
MSSDTLTVMKSVSHSSSVASKFAWVRLAMLAARLVHLDFGEPKSRASKRVHRCPPSGIAAFSTMSSND